MAQAAVDLPDPLEQPPLSSLPNADDLLAQLAGDDIDRMLAEAQADEEPAAREGTDPGTQGTSKTLAPDDPELAKELDQLFDQLDQETELQAPQPEAPAPAAEAPAATESAGEPAVPANQPSGAGTGEQGEVSRQLDALFDELNAPGAGGAPQAGASMESAADGAPQQGAGAATDPADESGALERQVLAAGLHEDSPTAHASPEPDPEFDHDRLPIYLKPLEWMNLPLSGCSEGVREAIGKIAIVTLVNALAILIYLILFGR